MKLNGCHNIPRPVSDTVTHWAQDGWCEYTDLTGHPVRMPRWTEIRHVMSTECQYSILTVDPRCAGCKWNQQEAVDDRLQDPA